MCQFVVNFTDEQVWINKNLNYRKKNHPVRGQLHFIPGKLEKLPLKLVDDLCGEIMFHVSVQVISGTVSVDPAYSIITTNSIVLHGRPNDSGTIHLSTVGVRYKAISVNVILDECPPGFYPHSNKTCICSAHCPSYHHPGIERCDNQQFRAYVKHGYWIGYLTNDSSNLSSAICPAGFCSNITHWLWKGLVLESESELARALCPKGFCNFSVQYSSEHLLASDRTEDLSQYICHPNRKGKICGVCTANHSAFYHSNYFSCKPNDYCYLGWLFYILAELLPVTLLFLVVIFFNISFTSGPLNGVVFFMQMVDTLKLSAENFIRIHPYILKIASIYKFVYRSFTLSTFAIEELSFCLWSNSSALDMLAFRYVTITYSLILVVITVLLLRVCNCQRPRKLTNLKHSIIHGLSAFLVMSYSECTRVSLMIITRGTVTVGPERNENYTYRVFYNGEYPYMEGAHFKYAIPAIFFIMTMVSIPPLLLLSYPLCYKLFALLRIEESRCVQITCKIFPLEKIKPLFDAMQGTFKDRYRCFAGLYFLYRLCILLTFAYTVTLTSYYTIIGVQLVFMLVLHAICRPYRVVWHNILDGLLLSNLAIINALTSYNYKLASTYMYSSDEGVQNWTQKWTSVQIVLVFLPLLYLVSYTTFHIIKMIKTACGCKSKTLEKIDDSNEVIDNLDMRGYENSLMGTNDYMLMGLNQE